MTPWRSLGQVYVPPPAGPSEKSFGLTVGGVLAVAAAVTGWRGHAVRAQMLGGIGAVLMVAAIVRPCALRGIAAGWGRIGHALGWFNSRVLLTVMFAVVFIPIGLIGRLFGADLLRRRPAASGWSPCSARLRERKHFERLF